MLGGLDSPTEGRVLVDGADIYKLSDRGRAGIRNKKISFVFQFYHLLPEFTALENVMMPWLIGSGFQVPGSRDGKKWMRERAREVLRLVGLEERTDHRPGELSGGESQRVAVARALMNTPEVLLCDEPTGNLDSKTSDSVLELLTGLKSKEGMALVIVTHNEAVSSIADRTLHMRDGRIS
jgi:lipoprotein-releasing system ATP-binding protein